jgi:membrane protease YdiL (CAAX protease family)
MKSLRLPLAAAIAAIAITTTMDFTGYLVFSALPLAGLILVFWLIQRQSKAEIGLVLGSPKDYGLALLYPVVVLGLAALAGSLSGAVSLDEADWGKLGINVLVGSTVGVLMVILTEEGFFRGWLWGAFRRANLSEGKTLAATSLLFTAWHVSAVTSGTEYGLPWSQIPVYLANATLLSLIWGLMRRTSGSVVVPGVSHAVWNACAYGLFGFGTKAGELGIENTAFFGPEVGFLGLLLNGAFFVWLYSRARTRGRL